MVTEGLLTLAKMCKTEPKDNIGILDSLKFKVLKGAKKKKKKTQLKEIKL